MPIPVDQPQYAGQVDLAQLDIIELLARFEREGFDRHVVLAAMTGATMALAGAVHGDLSVASWLARAAALSKSLNIGSSD